MLEDINPIEKIAQYFESIAKNIDSDRNASGIFDNRSDSGSAREDIIIRFLETHIPRRLHVSKGGFVINSEGKISKQIDILITNDLTIQFNHFAKTDSIGKSFNILEGCLSIISVKSYLDKTSLIESLENLGSVPLLNDYKLKSNDPYEKYLIEQLPMKAIFAYDGSEPQTIVNHIHEHYAKKGNIDLRLTPQMIIVNNKYLINRSGKDGALLVDGTRTKPYEYFFQDGHRAGGFGLFYLLGYIQSLSNLINNIAFSFNKYSDVLIKKFREEDKSSGRY